MAKRKSAAAVAEPDVQPPSPQQPHDYTVLARRYRPQQFKDLIGQEAVVQALTNALQSNRVAHAYLFTGLRGVGKTSAARIMAKALNCVNGPTPTPCDQCDMCNAMCNTCNQCDHGMDRCVVSCDSGCDGCNQGNNQCGVDIDKNGQPDQEQVRALELNIKALEDTLSKRKQALARLRKR